MKIKPIKDVINNAPGKPGVYVFRDGEDSPLYVGKASSLKTRLRSYLRVRDIDQKTKVMLERAESLDYTVVDSESEALLLEYNLIKEHSPRFNVRYRDDKRYPYIKVTSECFPRILVTRRKVADGGRYFGPYPDGGHVRKILRIVKQYFGLRTCRGDALRQKPCLSLHIGRCVGPCTGKVGQDEYQRRVEEASLFLGGRISELSKVLSERMREYADRQEFENAAVLRDKLAYLDSIMLERKVSAGDGKDRDYVAYALEGDCAGISVFKERNGMVVDHFFFRLEGEFASDEAESLSAFISQYYSTAHVPDEIVSSPSLRDDGVFSLLRRRKGGKVVVRAPKRGRLKRLLSLAGRNARLQLATQIFNLGKAKALDALAGIVGVDSVNRIEGFDVSNISGRYAVGSMVVFEEGKPVKSGYRRFRIKSVSGADDVAMMSEITSRRFGNSWQRPDVVLVDGGRGQVNAARRVLRRAGLIIPVVGLAKEHEDLYVGGRPGTLSLPLDSPVMKLLVRVRDEAHRFAVTYHRRIRSNVIVSGGES